MKTVLKVIILSLCILIGATAVAIVSVAITKGVRVMFNEPIAFVVNLGIAFSLAAFFAYCIIRDNR